MTLILRSKRVSVPPEHAPGVTRSVLELGSVLEHHHIEPSETDDSRMAESADVREELQRSEQQTRDYVGAGVVYQVELYVVGGTCGSACYYCLLLYIMRYSTHGALCNCVVHVKCRLYGYEV